MLASSRCHKECLKKYEARLEFLRGMDMILKKNRKVGKRIFWARSAIFFNALFERSQNSQSIYRKNFSKLRLEWNFWNQQLFNIFRKFCFFSEFCENFWSKYRCFENVEIFRKFWKIFEFFGIFDFFFKIFEHAIVLKVNYTLVSSFEGFLALLAARATLHPAFRRCAAT